MKDLEEEMRCALFGAPTSPVAIIKSTPTAAARLVKRTPSKVKTLSPKLRVTLNVTETFEGETEIFIYDANTLSTITAELDAKAMAKKKNFKYFNLVSIQPIG